MIPPRAASRTRFSVVLLFATVGAVGVAMARELAVNGGFEEAAKGAWLAGLKPEVREYFAGAKEAPFAGWAFGGRWEHGEYACAVSEEAHAGRRACEITCVKKGRGGMASSPLEVAAGTVLEVSCWLRAREANGGRVFLNFEGSPGDGWASKDLKTGTYDWTRFTQRVVVPASKNGGPQTVVVFLYTTCEGSLWVDDFSIQAVAAGAAAHGAEARKPAALAEPEGSTGYRVNVVSPLEKVFREDDFSATTQGSAVLAAARNEYESVQVVIEAPWRSVAIREVRLSDLQGPGGARIPASALQWARVEYVETTVTPPYFAERGLGAYPDPLLPAGAFTVEARSRAPVWVTVKTPKECPAGDYTGSITIVPEGRPATTIPVRLTVWDFTIGDETHLRTLTWLGAGQLRDWYGLDDSPAGREQQAAALRNYQDVLLEHRLGPGGEVASRVQRGADGKFDFHEVDVTLQRLIGRGMNAFIMGSAPNLAREKKSEYTAQFTQEFTAMLKAYGDHLREKGWLGRAYVYVYDEAPRAAWPEVKKIDQAIHAAVPQARILQCLNEPEGVRELTGFADVFDVYVPHYEKAGVAESQTKGAEVWLASCCYPMEHPNFFLEYPLLDARVTPWVCWRHHAAGFEYWSPNAWGVNNRSRGAKWPQAPWVANAFGKYNGDGYLLYPGADLKPCSSLRLEAFRDGVEDYEYLWLLNSLVEQAERKKLAGPTVDAARALLSLGEVVKASGAYSPRAEDYLTYRRRVAEGIVAVRKLMEKGE